jgi:hypothetical protein
VTGAPIQALMLYGIGLLFGSYFAAQYGLAPGLGGAIGLRATLAGWYFAQGCLLVLAAMISAFVLLLSLATRGKGNVISLLIVALLLGGWVAVLFIPGLALLTGVLSAGVLVGLLTSAKVGGNPIVIAAAGVLQFVFALILLAAACGKLRAPDRPLFSLRLSLLLLLVWGFTLVAGVYAAPGHNWLFDEWSEYGYAQLVGSTIAFIAVGLVAGVAAAVDLFRHDRAATFGEQSHPRQRLTLQLVPLALALLTLLCFFLMMRGLRPTQLASAVIDAFGGWSPWVAIGVAMLLSFWIDFNWVYFLEAHGRRILVSLVIMLVLLKVVPLGLDAAIEWFVRELADRRWIGYGYLSAVSPVGTLVWAAKGGVAVWVGLAFQALLAVGATLLGRRVRQRLGRTEAPPMPVGSVAVAS